MSATDLEATVRRLLDLTVSGDVAGSAECFSEDARYFVEAWHEPKVGRAEIVTELERQRTLFSDFRYVILSSASAGRTLFTERVDTVNMGGRDVDLHTVGVFEIGDDGLITRWSDYLDMSEIAAQMS
jgi:limonene-1,2-epoxide hydrolase